MIELLLSGRGGAAAVDVNARGQGGWTPLGLAVRAGDEAAIRALLAKGADPSLPCMGGGKSALDIARANQRTAAIELLVGAKASGGVSLE